MEKKWKELSIYKQVVVLTLAIFILYNIATNLEVLMREVHRFLNVLTPFVTGCMIAYFLSRPVIGLDEKFAKSKLEFVRKKSHVLATLSVFLVVIAIVTVVVSYVAPVIVDSLRDFISNVPMYYNNAIDWARDLGPEHWLYQFLPEIPEYNTDVATDIIDALAPTDATTVIDTGIIAFVTTTLGMVASNIVSVGTILVNFALGLIIALYLLLYRTSVIALVDRIAVSFVKPKSLKFLKTYLHKSNEVFYKFISAQFLDACILGTIAFILLAILGVEYAMTLALLLGLCNMIPFFGSIFATIVTTVITIFTGGPQQAFLVFGALLALQQVDANFISPKITGDALGLNPLLIVTSIFIGGEYLGIIGMFIAVPVAAMCKIFLEEYLTMREEKQLIKSKLPILADKELT